MPKTSAVRRVVCSVSPLQCIGSTRLEASIAKLTEDIGELTKAVAELDAAMAKATKIRHQGE